ncbi:lipopolysaccharide biosynthesis protein [Nonomuraea sp. 10N515B]|uniref:lipopolysaccharide biosynthesis protein n=1 Tax=Nonomuraea sp. 10N515B TaxID=3457422 RepID=UPI003FCEC8D9
MTSILIARTLAPEGRGIYALVITTATIAIVAGHLSVNKSQIAMWLDPARHPFLAANSLILGLISGVLSGLCTFGILIVFASVTVPDLLAIALLAVPFSVASINLSGIALLQSRISLVNRAVVTWALALSLPVLALKAMGCLTITNAVICWTMSAAARFIIVVGPLGCFGLRGKASLARQQLALSSRYHIGVLAQHLLLTLDIFLLNTLVSPTEVGLYAVAGGFLALAWVPTDAISQVALHRQATEDEPDACQVTARALRYNILFSSLVVAAMAVMSPVLIPLLYGNAYAASVKPLLLLAPGVIALSVVRLADQFLIRLDRPLTLAVIPVGALALNIALNAVLIPRWGASGAAISASCSYIALAFIEVLWFARTAGIDRRDLIPRVSDLRSAAAFLLLVVRRTPSS